MLGVPKVEAFAFAVTTLLIDMGVSFSSFSTCLPHFVQSTASKGIFFATKLAEFSFFARGLIHNISSIIYDSILL